MKILLYYCYPCQQEHVVCHHPKPDELQLMLPQLINLKPILMSWHLNSGLQSRLFLLGSPTKTMNSSINGENKHSGNVL